MNSRESYWQRMGGAVGPRLLAFSGSERCDVAVIGAGVTGASTAFHLARDRVDVVVLEAEQPGSGATGRSAGMIVPAVSKLSAAERVTQWGPDAAARSGQIASEAVQSTRRMIRDARIECSVAEGGWLMVAHRHQLAERPQATADAFRTVLGISADPLDRQELASGGYIAGPAAHGGVLVCDAFGVDPLAYVRGIATAAQSLGARLYGESPVLKWTREGRTHVLHTPAGTLRASKVVLATDAYGQDSLLPALRGRILRTTGSVLVTEPLSESQWDSTGIAGTFLYTDMREVLHYWRRLPDGRLLFGGRGPGPGRSTGHLRWLASRMRTKFPGLDSAALSHYWSGTIGLTYDRAPHLGPVGGDPTVLHAGGYLGTGLALGTLWGEQLAGAAQGAILIQDTPMTSRPMPKFPAPALRRAYFPIARAGFELRDRWRP